MPYRSRYRKEHGNAVPFAKLRRELGVVRSEPVPSSPYDRDESSRCEAVGEEQFRHRMDYVVSVGGVRDAVALRR